MRVSPAVLAITERSGPTSPCTPAASLAPPVPPARSATRLGALTPATRLADAGDPNPRAGLGAGGGRTVEPPGLCAGRRPRGGLLRFPGGAGRGPVRTGSGRLLAAPA